MQTKLIEALAKPFYGKFLVGRFDAEEWKRRALIAEPVPQAPILDELYDPDPTTGLPSLLRSEGWGDRHHLVLDVSTGCGAIFFTVPSGYPAADIKKRGIEVCPLFEPFLQWLYQQDLTDLDALPDQITLDVDVTTRQPTG